MSSITSRTFSNVDNHVISLFRIVSSLFDVNNVNSKFADVKLKLGSRTFYCHKFVLQFNSTYLKSQLDQLHLPKVSFGLQSVKLKMPTNPDFFSDVLQFMYTAEVIVSKNNIESLIIAADILCMDQLAKICLRFLDDGIKNCDLEIEVIYLKLSHICSKWIIHYFNRPLSCLSSCEMVSEEFMKVILCDDNLKVKSEEEFCEMLIKWVKVQTEAGHAVHLDQLLPLIRWSGVYIDFIESKFLQNATLKINPVSTSFLSNVITSLKSGVQFEGLRTFHRPSTGLENTLVTVLHYIDSTKRVVLSTELSCISLQHPNRVRPIDNIPIKASLGSAACLCDRNVYITIAGNNAPNETWKWEVYADRTRCADMLTGRRHHCAAAVDSMLFVLGGINDDTTYSSVECYDTRTDAWSSAGHLIHAISSAACVTYKNNIYVFGGFDKDNQCVAHVQVYDPRKKSCTMMENPMPFAIDYIETVLWETSVIVLSWKTCFIYNFETQCWLERMQFKTSLISFATIIDNSTIYIAGGVTLCPTEDFKLISKYTADVKCVSVHDVINDKPASWKLHTTLPMPAVSPTYISSPVILQCSTY